MSLRLSAVAVIAAAAVTTAWWASATFAQVDPLAAPPLTPPPPGAPATPAPPPVAPTPQERVVGVQTSNGVRTKLVEIVDSKTGVKSMMVVPIQLPGDAAPLAYDARYGGMSGMMSGGEGAMAPPSRKELLIRQIVNNGDAVNHALAAELATELGKEFDARIAQQEAEVKALEARVTKLRGQLDARKAAKQNIVQRRAEDLVNEAKGLGWPGGAPAQAARGVGFPPTLTALDPLVVRPKMEGGNPFGGAGVMPINPNDPRMTPEMKAAAEEAQRQGVKFMMNPELMSAFSNQPNNKTVEQARAAAAKVRDANNLRQILLALHQYHEKHDHLPAPDWRGTGGDAAHAHSWRVALLPYLGPEAAALYEQYIVTIPWDAPHNAALTAKMPAVFKTNGVAKPGMTGFKAFIGPGNAWEKGKQLKFADFQDGLSNTAMIGVDPDGAVEWNKPEEAIKDRELPPGIAVLVGMADGSTRTIPANATKEQWKALLTRAGGEVAPTVYLPASELPTPTTPAGK